TALPGGMRKPHSWDISGYNWGRFTERGSGGHWWTTLDDMDSLAYSRAVYYFDTEINRYLYNQQYGFAIRCVSDSSTNQINEFPNSDRIIIYLNPATTTLTIDGLGATATTEVYDLSGKLLLREMLLSHSLDISRLATGLYFIKLTTAEGIVVRKFVKE
ncbi:MAG: T9SS type A sorting domain-containing protein, partial [Bacteroidota bacterium]